MQVVLGAIIAILVTICVENLRRPRLQLSIEVPPLDVSYPPGRPAKDVRYLRLKLFNKPLTKWMLRAPALQCRGLITFHHLDGQDIFGRAMAVRWSSSPQPVPTEVVDLLGVPQFRIVDIAKLTSESRIDVYPGETELLDVAVRFDSEADCYGWNNEAYFSPTLWRTLDWKLGAGRYLVKVVVISSGQKVTAVFRLMNDVSRNAFRLEMATKDEWMKVT